MEFKLKYDEVKDIDNNVCTILRTGIGKDKSLQTTNESFMIRHRYKNNEDEDYYHNYNYTLNIDKNNFKILNNKSDQYICSFLYSEEKSIDNLDIINRLEYIIFKKERTNSEIDLDFVINEKNHNIKIDCNCENSIFDDIIIYDFINKNLNTLKEIAKELHEADNSFIDKKLGECSTFFHILSTSFKVGIYYKKKFEYGCFKKALSNLYDTCCFNPFFYEKINFDKQLEDNV